MTIKIGTAGWTIPRDVAHRFPADGSGLERYASLLPVAEINSSFHRPHRLSTWERWRDSVPASFRFSVKVPKEITHQRKLIDCAESVDAWLEQTNVLGDKLAVLLVQLPPKLPFDKQVAESFFNLLRHRSDAAIACEPRNASWFTDEADVALKNLRVARVAADPALCDAAALPGGWGGLSYFRLHGSPVMYRSSYGERIDHYAELLRNGQNSGSDCWCIFDNTASSAAMADALALMAAVKSWRLPFPLHRLFAFRAYS